jgi:hypothetical protein
MQAKRDHPDNFGEAVTQIASEISMNIPASATTASGDHRGNNRHRAMSAADTTFRGRERSQGGRAQGRGRGGRYRNLS